MAASTANSWRSDYGSFGFTVSLIQQVAKVAAVAPGDGDIGDDLVLEKRVSESNREWIGFFAAVGRHQLMV